MRLGILEALLTIDIAIDIEPWKHLCYSIKCHGLLTFCLNNPKICKSKYKGELDYHYGREKCQIQ